MRAIVCGAGIAGLTAAVELGRAGWDVTVLERAPRRREQGYMIDFFGPGFIAAEELGIMPRLRELAYPVDRLDLVDGEGRVTGGADYGRVVQQQGGRLISLLRQDLELVLFEALPDSVEVRFGAGVVDVAQTADAVTAVLADGATEVGDVLIGADGIHSAIRDRVFGPEHEWMRYLGFHTFAFEFDDAGVAHELGRTFHLTDTADRLIGVYALRQDRVTVFGAYRSPEKDLPSDRRGAVLQVFEGMGWRVPDVLRRWPDDGDVYFDQVAQIELPAWSDGRVALVGDACGAVSLLAGQGASLAVAGGQRLARELIGAERRGATSGHAEAFARYEQALQPLVAAKQRAGRRAASSFLPTSRRMLWLRRVALRMMQWPLVARIVRARIVG